MYKQFTHSKHSNQLIVINFLKFSDSSQRSTLQADLFFQGQQFRPDVLTLACTETIPEKSKMVTRYKRHTSSSIIQPPHKIKSSSWFPYFPEVPPIFQSPRLQAIVSYFTHYNQTHQFLLHLAYNTLWINPFLVFPLLLS